MNHAEIIRRNLPLLKRDLHPGEMLDYLWSTGAFSDLEYEICKEEDKKRAQTEKLLEILMKKEEDVYKKFCVVLHNTHPHLKEQLDKTAKHEDFPSLVFVSETEVQQRVSVMEQKVAVLQEELDTSRQEAQHTKAEWERDVKELNVQHGQQETYFKKENSILSKQLEQEKNRTKAVQAMLEEMKGKNERMSKDLKEIQQKFEALTVIHIDRETSEKRDSLTSQATPVEETGCVLKTSSGCDTRQLLLLPCLHAACKSCIDQLDLKNIVCSCGRDINMVKESGTVDFVRRNEITFAKEKPECEYQTGQCKGEVVRHCKTCNISMCANCTTKHETTRATSQHTVVLAEEFKKMPIRERLDLQNEIVIFKDQEKDFKMERKRLIEVLKDNQESLGIYFLDARKIDRSSILQCIHLKYDKDRVNLDDVHINTEGDLVNGKSDTRHAGEGRLKKYDGTCSTAPLPRAGCPQYWEVVNRVSLDKPLTGNYLILEVGVCREEQRDVSHCIDGQSISYSLDVAHCPTHGGICSMTCKEGKRVLHLPDTLPNTAGTSHTLHYGVVFDDARRKIIFIDVKENKVMSTLDNVDSSQPMWPMFGVYNPRRLTVSMTLVVGSDINMTEEKKAMIVQALSRW